MNKKKLEQENIQKNNQKKISPKAKEKRTLNITVYIALRGLIIICLIGQALRGNWNNVFSCILALILFTLPNLLSSKLNFTLPTTLEIIVYIFIFSAEILGEVQNFYGTMAHWDTLMHTLNGFLCAAVGFSLIDILNNNENLHWNMSPAFVALVAFCFSMTVGACWELFEFTVDQMMSKDMQKDRIITQISSLKLNSGDSNIPVIIDNIDETIVYSNNKQNIMIIEGGYLDIGLIDTMKDLMVNFVGAVIFSIFGYLYIKNRDGYKLVEVFIPKLKGKKE